MALITRATRMAFITRATRCRVTCAVTCAKRAFLPRSGNRVVCRGISDNAGQAVFSPRQLVASKLKEALASRLESSSQQKQEAAEDELVELVTALSALPAEAFEFLNASDSPRYILKWAKEQQALLAAGGAPSAAVSAGKRVRIAVPRPDNEGYAVLRPPQERLFKNQQQWDRFISHYELAEVVDESGHVVDDFEQLAEGKLYTGTLRPSTGVITRFTGAQRSAGAAPVL